VEEGEEDTGEEEEEEEEAEEAWGVIGAIGQMQVLWDEEASEEPCGDGAGESGEARAASLRCVICVRTQARTGTRTAKERGSSRVAARGVGGCWLVDMAIGMVAVQQLGWGWCLTDQHKTGTGGRLEGGWGGVGVVRLVRGKGKKRKKGTKNKKKERKEKMKRKDAKEKRRKEKRRKEKKRKKRRDEKMSPRRKTEFCDEERANPEKIGWSDSCEIRTAPRKQPRS
jgi:hypothetical protein